MGAEREVQEHALKSLWQLFKADSIDLYFADEATFSMVPALPYARAGKRASKSRSFRERDKKVNLFGIFRADNVAITYQSQANVNSEFLIRSIDDFCRYLDKPTAPVIDNAPTHRSKLFAGQFSKWEEKGLYIFFLPKYSPHLNIAETYWRKAKYEWLSPGDYFSFARYKRKIKEIFNKIGTDYKIIFKELKV